jgi:hypothetical protein
MTKPKFNGKSDDNIVRLACILPFSVLAISQESVYLFDKLVDLFYCATGIFFDVPIPYLQYVRFLTTAVYYITSQLFLWN